MIVKQYTTSSRLLYRSVAALETFFTTDNLYFAFLILLNVQDRDFRKGAMKLSHHMNPNAEVSSTIHHYMKYTLMKAYRGEDIFWGTTPKAGDYIRFHFVPPVVIEE